MNNNFASNLKYLRIRKGLTQEQLGKQLKKDYSTIGKWENGSRTPIVEDAIKIAEYFEINLNDLLMKDLLFEEAKVKEDIIEISPKELSNEVKTLLLRTGKLSDSEKAHIISTLDLICRKEEE